MVNIKFYCSLRNFQQEDIEKNDLIEDFILTTKADIIEQAKSEVYFVSVVGLALLQSFKNQPYLYHFYEDKSNVVEVTDVELSEILSSGLHTFFGFLWFVKDNSANINTLVTYNIETKYIHYRHRNRDFSNCEGLFKPTTFSTNDLKRTVEIMNKIRSISQNRLQNESKEIQYELGSTQLPVSNFLDYNSSSRIDRAVNFLMIARSTSSLVMKIPFYLPIYEALFSTDKIEISHQISERVAFYIGGTYEEKLNNYKMIREAYSFRSSFFHGDNFDKKYKGLPIQRDLALRIDNITRHVLTKVIMEDSDKFLNNDKKTFQEWLLKLVISS